MLRRSHEPCSGRDHGSVVGHRKRDRWRTRRTGIPRLRYGAVRGEHRAREGRARAAGRSGRRVDRARRRRSARKAGHIDLLVNNAGGSLDGAFEETPLGQARDLFELNFFGAVRMTQAVLPAMRARKSGRIVFVSSVLGFLPAPFMGFYAASKHALEGLAESLDHETRTLGIRVALVEPGYTRTNFDANGPSAPALVADYAAALDRTRAKMRAALSAGDEPEMVAEAVLKAATSKKPRLRYPAGSRAGLLRRLRRYLPASILDGALRKEFGLDDTGAKHASFP